MSEMINHPKHYNSGKIEVIEFIEDQKLNFARGSVIKYASRAGKKDPAKEIEDLEKAVWYLKREIELLRADDENREPLRPNDMNPKQEELDFHQGSLNLTAEEECHLHGHKWDGWLDLGGCQQRDCPTCGIRETR
jgi:hypothetical protein